MACTAHISDTAPANNICTNSTKLLMMNYKAHYTILYAVLSFHKADSFSTQCGKNMENIPCRNFFFLFNILP